MTGVRRGRGRGVTGVSFERVLTREAYADGGEQDAPDAREEENDNEAETARPDQLLPLGNGAAADDERLCPHDEEVRPHGADACFEDE